MNRNKFFIATAFFIAQSIPLFSQTGTTVTWEETLAIAKNNNPDLLSAAKSLAAAQAEKSGSYNGLLPNASLSSRYTDSDLHNKSTRWGASMDANIELFNLKNIAAVKSASAALDQAEANYKLRSAKVRFDLHQAFADLLLAQAQVNVSERIKNIRKNNAQLVSLKYDSGRESKGNMLRSNAERTEAEATLADAVRQLRVAQANLNRQLGRDDFGAVTASGTLSSVTTTENIPDTLALTNEHPQVRVQSATRDVATARVTTARGNILPTLSGNYARSFNGDSFFPNDEAHWSASGVLSYPIFASGPTYAYYSISSAKRAFEAAEADLRSVQNQVRASIESAWAAWLRDNDAEKVQAQFLVAAQQRNDEATIRYSSGLMSYEDWELVVTDLVNFERSAIRAERNAVVSNAAWEQAIGKTLEE